MAAIERFLIAESADSMIFRTKDLEFAIKASPMAANIQIVFFENKKGDILVKFLHNEKEVHVAVKTDMWPYYHWNDVREYYLERLSKL